MNENVDTTPHDTTSQEAVRAASRRADRRALIATLTTLGVLVAGVIVMVVWRTLSSPSEAPSFDRFRPGFESAMRKAGVEATFPAGPVDLADVRASGRHPFTATFSGEEITALVNVYRFEPPDMGADISLMRATVTFDSPDVVRLDAVARVDGGDYSAELIAPTRFSDGAITSPGAEKVAVEGIPLGGSRARQATTLLLDYLNAYLKAAPALTVKRARVVTGGVEVSGFAPTRIATRTRVAP